MLQRLELKNFTVFQDATFKFSENLNVIHGVNGVGKSHVLKMVYTLQHALADPPSTARGKGPVKGRFQRALAAEIVEIFQPDALGRLVTRGLPGRRRAEVSARFATKGQRTSFSFHSASKTEVKLEDAPSKWLAKRPVFLPTREVMTIYPGFVSLYENHAIGYDRTWRDLCILLGAPLSTGPKAAQTKSLLAPLEDAMEGRITLDAGGRFYLVGKEGRLEMHLVSEGIRKLAMVARLIATGGLVGKGCLIWDEPDANMNPRLVKKIAEVLFILAKQGVQVFIATHSLFLMRELSILQASGDMDVRYFGLQRQEAGGVLVEQGSDLVDSGDIAALDENLEQSDRYLDLDA